MNIGSGKAGVELGNYRYAALNSDGDSFVQPVNSGMHPDFLDNQNQYGAQVTPLTPVHYFKHLFSISKT
jgi:hypothetical protein